jgi:hypothetical protein
MVINASKSKFICVNGDSKSFDIGQINIEHTESYTYLGTPISVSPITKQVQDHLSAKNSHVLKFMSFLTKNSDAPWQAKYKVWDSAVKTALFFSCQTWLTNNLRPAESVYNNLLKLLLGVRNTVCNDLVHVELGLGNAKSFIKQRQKEYLGRLQSRDWYNGSYIAQTINMAIETRSPAGIILQQIINASGDYIHSYKEETEMSIRSATSSRRITYLEINPNLSVHPMYKPNCIAKEKYRIATTRLRLGAHRLKIETGRWSRLPRELRLCVCGQVQTEHHALCQCPLTQHIRDRDSFANIDFTSVHSIMENSDIPHIIKYCFCVTDFFKCQ